MFDTPFNTPAPMMAAPPSATIPIMGFIMVLTFVAILFEERRRRRVFRAISAIPVSRERFSF